MPDSILDTVKNAIGIVPEDNSFDVDLIMHINSIFMILNQLGIGPDTGFKIQDNTTEWSDYLGIDSNLEAVKSHMILRVKALFDPPPTSFTQEAFGRQVSEIEWRLILQKESEEPIPPVP